jgi:hypothetical protein
MNPMQSLQQASQTRERWGDRTVKSTNIAYRAAIDDEQKPVAWFMKRLCEPASISNLKEALCEDDIHGRCRVCSSKLNDRGYLLKALSNPFTRFAAYDASQLLLYAGSYVCDACAITLKSTKCFMKRSFLITRGLKLPLAHTKETVTVPLEKSTIAFFARRQALFNALSLLINSAATLRENAIPYVAVLAETKETGPQQVQAKHRAVHALRYTPFYLTRTARSVQISYAFGLGYGAPYTLSKDWFTLRDSVGTVLPAFMKLKKIKSRWSGLAKLLHELTETMDISREVTAIFAAQNLDMKKMRGLSRQALPTGDEKLRTLFFMSM